MRHISREDLDQIELPGRIIQKAVGGDSFSHSMEMTVGFASYSQVSGPMDPHHHAEEVIYVLDAKNAWVEFGKTKDKLENKKQINPGDILHFPELEWHVFNYGNDGYLDIVFIYGSVENIRPEEINSN